MVDVVHPLLRGGRPHPPHKFSKAEMKVFAAMCDTIFPSLPVDEPTFKAHMQHITSLGKEDVQALEAYLCLSAKDTNIPLAAAGDVAKFLKPADVRHLKLALWLLSSAVGTLIVGSKNAGTSWTSLPFFCKFASMPLEQRQRLLWGLSRSPVLLKQELFRCLTNFIPWALFSAVDAHGFNPTFRAIHYAIPSSTATGSCATSSLPSRVIDVDVARDRLASALASLGASTISDVSHLKALRRRQATADVEIGVKCDAVVVGSGPGGAVVAAKLAKAGRRVIVLEKGRYFKPSQLSNLEGPSMRAMYEGSGCVITDDSRMILLAGATLGGGSTINWSASFRTPGHVRREWAQSHHLDLFSSARYEHAMDAVCTRLGVQPDVAHENFQNGVLRAGCHALGYHVDNIPRNSRPDHQCGFCGLGCKQEKKQGTTETWLEDAAAAGAVILTACHAEEVLVEKQKKDQRRMAMGVVATAMENDRSLHRLVLYVEADVVVAACGALSTPLLLRRSGLCNRAIGRNLHIHPVQLLWGHFEAGAEAVPAGHSYEGGIMTAYSNVAGNWDTTGYGALIQCPGTQPGIISTLLPWTSGREFKSRMLKFPRTAYFIVLTRDQGAGRVYADKGGLRSVRYQLAKVDKASLREGAEKGLRVLVAAGAREIGTCNVDGESFELPKGGGRGTTSAGAEFEAYLGRVRCKSFKGLSTMTVSAHQMGSCRMGVCPSTSAVRASGEAWEVEGLFVADSSVFPTATGVNPMITVQSIAFCVADAVLLHLQKRRPMRSSNIII